MTNILLSQLGVADPIQNGLDAAMLHIYRHNPIDKVVLFDTGASKYKKDNFLKALNSVREIPENNIYFLDRKDDLPDASDFQACENIIMGELIKLLNKMKPDDTIYLNLSSGSPALISAVYSVGQIYPNTKMVQVKLPERSEHKRSNGNELPSIEDLIESNADNEASAPNRCVEVMPNLILKPIADYYAKGSFDGIRFIIMVEGISDVDYIELILEHLEISGVLVLPCGGHSQIVKNYPVVAKYFSSIFAIVDGDLNNDLRKTDKKNLVNTIGSGNLHILKRRAIENYLSGRLNNGSEVISDLTRLNTSTKKTKQSENATIENIKDLEEELLPVLKKWGLQNEVFEK